MIVDSPAAEQGAQDVSTDALRVAVKHAVQFEYCGIRGPGSRDKAGTMNFEEFCTDVREGELSLVHGLLTLHFGTLSCQCQQGAQHVLLMRLIGQVLIYEQDVLLLGCSDGLISMNLSASSSSPAPSFKASRLIRQAAAAHFVAAC